MGHMHRKRIATDKSSGLCHEKAQLIERQQSQYDQLALHTEKMSALGRMAAGIAHEINNPLAGILLFSTNMLKKIPPESPFREGLELIKRETMRLGIKTMRQSGLTKMAEGVTSFEEVLRVTVSDD